MVLAEGPSERVEAGGHGSELSRRWRSDYLRGPGSHLHRRRPRYRRLPQQQPLRHHGQLGHLHRRRVHLPGRRVRPSAFPQPVPVVSSFAGFRSVPPAFPHHPPEPNRRPVEGRRRQHGDVPRGGGGVAGGVGWRLLRAEHKHGQVQDRGSRAVADQRLLAPGGEKRVRLQLRVQRPERAAHL